MPDHPKGEAKPDETWVTRLPSDSENAVPTTGQLPADNIETIGGPGQLPSQQPGSTIPLVPGYEILAELGRGGMGVVYKAKQKGLNRIVALKMILSGDHASRDEIDRFRTEAEALARLHHPHIIQVYQIDEHEGRPFFSMEFVDGGSLADRSLGGPLPPREAAQLLEMLAHAVHAAHQAGIIHRDLKPANILLSAERGAQSPEREERATASRAPHSALAVPKITDFGLAKRLEEDRGRTRSGDILGTPNYMAPEQAAGRISQIGPATDVHALGAILYELLTGRPPFGKETLLDTLEQVRSQDPEPPSRTLAALPRDLEVICLKCLRKSPGDRYTSAGALGDDLRRFLDGEPIQARPVSMRERARKWAGRHPMKASFVVLLTALLLAAPFVVFWWLDRQKFASDAEIARTASATRRRLFERIYTTRTPEGWVRNDLSRDDNTDTEPWSHSQALCSLLRCPEATLSECRDLLGGLELLRKLPRIENKGVRYGWLPRTGMAHTQAEPLLWGASAVVAALARPGLLTEEERLRLMTFLSEIHVILRTYAPTDPDGGWHIAPHPTQPRLQNTYVNVLALQTLLDTRRANLPWDGSEKRRDELIAQTASWLIRHFQATAHSPGWFKDNGSHDRVIEGLTLQAYAILLRAANEADYPLPEEIPQHARRSLIECGQRDLLSPDQSGYVSYGFRRHDGVQDTLRQNLTHLWYPWAVEASVRWLEYNRRHGPEKDRTGIRRVLAYLVVQLGPEAVYGGEAFTYIPAERLLALAALAPHREK